MSGQGNLPRVLAYCHDGVGIGHLRRTLNICQEIGSAFHEASFLVATGSPFTSLFNAEGGTGSNGRSETHRIDVLKLPALSKVNNEAYDSKYLNIVQ